MSVTDGLTNEPNQEFDWEAMAPSDAPAEEADTATEEAAAPATATPRDPETGQFKPTTPETPAASPEADTATEGQEDPAVQAFLAKYDGDVDKAIKAAAEAQSVIGRQGQELGQTREQMARMQGQLDALLATQQQAPALSQEDAEARAIELASTQGYWNAAQALANESLQGDGKAYDALLQNWVLEDPITATRFDVDFQMWKREEAAKAQAPGPDPVLQTVRQQQEVAAIGATLGQVAQERGAGWEAIAPFMDTAIGQVHPSVTALVASADPEERLAGTRIVADRAFALAQAAPPAPVPVKTPAQIAAEAAEARKLAGSQVATGSLRPAAAATPGSPEERTEAIAQFKAGFLENDRSISSGLTGGGAVKA